jgi:Cupin superfamily protein
VPGCGRYAVRWPTFPMKTHTPKLRAIMRGLFGRQASRFAAEWPREHVVGRVRLADLPEPVRTGDLSGVEALGAVYGGKLSVTGGRSNRQSQFPAQGSALAFYMNGMTVFFEDVGSHVASIQPWLRRFEEEIGMPEGNLRLTAFATRGDKGGLGFHYDGTDNIILQIKGKKRVQIADNPTVAYPLVTYNPGHALVSDDLFPCRGKAPPSKPVDPKVIELSPGMVLFMPAGMWHATEHKVESFSLSFVVEWPRAADLVLARLRMELLQSSEWRRPLYGAWSADDAIRADAEARLSVTLAGIAKPASRVRAADALAEVPSPTAAAAYFGPDTRFCRAPFMRFVLHRMRNGAFELQIRSTVSYTRSVLEIAPEYIPACKWIAAQRGQFSLGDLVEQTGVGLAIARQFLSTLTQVGPIARVPFRA